MATVTLDAVNKVYDNGFQAIYDLSLDIADSEFLVLVGPSGCGKSTALRMVAGLESITSGELRIGDRVVNDVEPKDRDIAMVFQNYALYPHMTVYDNIGFALKLARVPKPEIDSRVRKAAAILELEPYLDRKPGQLSGGQRQRVAMGRAIVRQPAAFLMDEPLSNLDAKLRVQMRAEIARLQRDLGVTTIYVTHDQVEAMTMGDRVAVLKDGYLQQVGTPQNLYDQPTNVFVAAFIGSPSMNLYEGVVTLDGDEAACRSAPSGWRSLPRRWRSTRRCRTTTASAWSSASAPRTSRTPPSSTDAPPDRRLKATVRLVEALGSELMVHLEIDDAKRVNSGDPDAPEELVGEGIANAVARFSPRSRVRVDEHVEIVVATENLHFFDADHPPGHLVRSVVELAARREGRSALDRPGEDAADEEALEEEEHRQWDRRLEERAGGEQVLGLPELAGLGGDDDRRRCRRLVGTDHRDGDEVVVPGPEELEDRECGEDGHRQREHEAPEDPEVVGPVDARRLEDVLGQRRHVVVQQEDRERHRERGVGEPDRGGRAGQVAGRGRP